jgi:DNA polymerase
VPYIASCAGCPYGGRAIGPRGDPASRIALVGEAPGKTEIAAGEPFRGPAGDLLGGALAVAGLPEADVFVTNAVACLPQPVRPRVRAIASCRARLASDLGMQPRAVIVTLGATAVRAVTGLRGFRVTKKAPDAELPSIWGRVVPTLHPAFVLRRGRGGPELQTLVHDLRRARRLASTIAD